MVWSCQQPSTDGDERRARPRLLMQGEAGQAAGHDEARRHTRFSPSCRKKKSSAQLYLNSQMMSHLMIAIVTEGRQAIRDRTW